MTARTAFNRLDTAGVPCEIAEEHPVIPDFLWDEWAFETGRVFEHHHPDHGWIREIGMYFHLSGSSPVLKSRAPTLGEHTDEIIDALGRVEGEPRPANVPARGEAVGGGSC
jgi:crotonobetainyl-CoA:carnitine CoA-transferase CaiB-like acyl-CoA transferase